MTEKEKQLIMDFLKEYSFKDYKEVYTNGSEVVPMFRVGHALDMVNFAVKSGNKIEYAEGC